MKPTLLETYKVESQKILEIKLVLLYIEFIVSQRFWYFILFFILQQANSYPKRFVR